SSKGAGCWLPTITRPRLRANKQSHQMPNQSLERTADRRENLLSMTLNSKSASRLAQLGLFRSAHLIFAFIETHCGLIKCQHEKNTPRILLPHHRLTRLKPTWAGGRSHSFGPTFSSSSRRNLEAQGRQWTLHKRQSATSRSDS